ncbi:hypothetical protein F4803DRAFT_567961 [Xylaria telfairii]|nr:hypothetical protein F4803DRAFT_567961 [Xylaria telfairii]
MHFWRSLAISACVIASSFSIAQPTTTTTTAAVPQSTACGDIVNDNSTAVVFRASLVYECLTSVPFNPAVASRFIAYYNDTIQFQANLAYLKNPPSSYQQPGVDLVAGLNQLQQGIDDGVFTNQYQFESALQRLIYAAHDGHLWLDAGILAVFSFASPQDLMSISLDGISEPKVYFAVDVIESEFFTLFQPSALEFINGVDVVTYLEQFAANNSVGNLEPHADWNQLMESAALDILGNFDIFSGGATFYPGPTVTWAFENGTTFTEDFLAVYFSQGPTGPLQTGGDFYNFFVLGYYPANFNPFDSTDDSGDDDEVPSSVAPTSTSTQQLATPTPTTVPSWNNSAYPEVPDVWQQDLGTAGGGFVSGYFLRSSSIAVLSIPSFDEYGEAINSFQGTVQRFIDEALAAGMTRVVVDVQHNNGGQPLLALDTFQRFFPNTSTFAGSRMRAHHAADVMGMTDTGLALGRAKDDPYYQALVANEFVVAERINAATGEYFHSWAGYYGPNDYNNDTFTNVQQYNLSDTLFDRESTGANFTSISQNPKASPPFAASDIIILSDGICGSSCSLFLESMHHDAGVRVVAAGGQPKAGPMQGASGTRGARQYGLNVLDNNINFVQLELQNQNSPDANFLPNRTEANDVFILDASINLRDQIRRGETTPLQFVYVPADCRIYYTPQTIYNYTNLWTYAANAIWNDTKLCVLGSTGLKDSSDSTDPSSPTSNNDTQSPMFGLDLSIGAIPAKLAPPDVLSDVLPNSRIFAASSVMKLQKCSPSNECGSGFVCKPAKQCQQGPLGNVCVPTCQPGDLVSSKCMSAIGFGTCRILDRTESTVGQQVVYNGWCDVEVLPPCQTSPGSRPMAPPPIARL